MAPKPLTYKKMSELGLLAEINRLILHPRGYCLEAMTHTSKDGTPFPHEAPKLRIVDDCHRSPCMSRSFSEPSLEILRDRLDRYWKSRRQVQVDRQAAFGDDIQRLPPKKRKR